MENDLIYIEVSKKILSAQGVLDLNISIELPQKEFIALFGTSGAGKTTLLRMLAGLTRPDQGIIRFGKETWFDSARGIWLAPQKRNIGYMFQDYALFPNMTVEENIRYAQPVKNMDCVKNLMEVLGLQEFAQKRPVGLSGGQRQRVALARAIARVPKLLLLDEPLSALDSRMRSDLQKEIGVMHDSLQTTTMMVSHDLSEIFRLANRVVCLDHGQVTRMGSPEKLFSNNDVSGKVQISGKVVTIQPQELFFILTIVTGFNQVIKVVAFENDVQNLHPGDQVMVFTKAFNPMIMKL